MSKNKWMVLGFLAVCALAWAAPAAAADTPGARPVPPGPGFLFEKDAYAILGSQGESGVSRAFSRLSLRLYGGYGSISAADVNDGSAFYFDLVELYAAEGMGTVTGGFSPLHGGYDFGADLVYQITPTIGVGLGAGFMRNSSLSTGTWNDGETTFELTSEPTLSAIPIRLGVFFTFPVAGKINLTAEVGGAYYAGLKFDYRDRVESAADEWNERSIGSLEAGSANLGFHGGLGLEYMFSPKMGFFVEAVGRYAKLKNFDQVTFSYNSSDVFSGTYDGKLYLASYVNPDFPVTELVVSETPPVDDEFMTYREPTFDLSGFSLRAGFRVRF